MKHFTELAKIFVFSLKILPKLPATSTLTFACRQVWIFHMKNIAVQTLKPEKIQWVSFLAIIAANGKWLILLHCPCSIQRTWCYLLLLLSHVVNLLFPVCFWDSSTFTHAKMTFEQFLLWPFTRLWESQIGFGWLRSLPLVWHKDISKLFSTTVSFIQVVRLPLNHARRVKSVWKMLCWAGIKWSLSISKKRNQRGSADVRRFTRKVRDFSCLLLLSLLPAVAVIWNKHRGRYSQ